MKGRPFLSGKDFDTLLYDIRDAVYCKSAASWRVQSYDDKDPFYPCARSEDNLKKMLSEQHRIALDSVWGYNDGHFIYCKVHDNFYPIVMMGRYCLINTSKSLTSNRFNNDNTESVNRSLYTPALSAQDYAGMEFAKDIQSSTGYAFETKVKKYLLSLETGAFIEFNNKTLSEILKVDDELSKEYADKKHSEESNTSFLLRFNQKYPFEFSAQ